MKFANVNTSYQLKEIRKQRIHELPVRAQEGVSRIEELLRKSRLLEPDGKPNPEWELYSAPTLEEAQAKASKGMRVMSIVYSILSFRMVRVNGSIKRAHDAFWKAAVLDSRAASMHSVDVEVLGMAYRLSSDAIKRVTGRAERSAASDGMAHAISDVAMVAAESKVALGLNFSGKSVHIRIAEAAFEPVPKGYCFAGEVDGVIFAYYADPNLTTKTGHKNPSVS